MQLPNLLKIQNLTDLLLKNRWPWHVGFWLVYALSRAFSYYLTVMFYPEYLVFMLIVEVPFVIMVYFTVWMYRKLVHAGRFWGYFSFGIMLWAAYLAGVIFFQKYILQHLQTVAEASASDLYLNSATKYFFTFVLLTMAVYFKENFIRQQLERQQKQLQTESELRHLKAQVSPHFLFNTLNNFYGLAVERSEKLPGLMVQLSGLLRYSLYEAQNATVPLGQEVGYLIDYIELEIIRLEDSLEFDLKNSVPADCGAQIAPLLLVVFLENAFKHAKNVTDSHLRIKVSIALDSAGDLIFGVKNNCLATDKKPGQNHGIGLENVRKRLAVLYPDGRHSLETGQKDGEFTVNLRIKLAGRT